jgi:hypothetical protein
LQGLRWLGPIAVVAALAGIAAMQIHPVADRGMLERGALAVLLGYPRALPLLGLGCALALVRGRATALAAGLAVLGIWLGLEYRDLLINTAISGAATRVRLGLPGPISCLAVGVVLAAPTGLRSWLLFPAAIMVGAMLAIGIKLVDPSFHDPDFLRGALAASLWLVGAVGLTVHLVHARWLGIAARIFGSWLIAIGLMLVASILVPRPTIGAAPPQPAQALERTGSLDLFPDAPAVGRRKSHLPQPGFDPSLQ